ncbi:MAG: EpsG family protein [Muribaculaceae bacterium]|nr:EpsG family protein [Muribaculaceae bacterium]
MDKRISKFNNGGILLVSIVVIIFSGCRMCGYDYYTYLDHFNSLPDLYAYKRQESTFEVGYEYVVSAFKTFSNNFNLFLFFYALVTILMVIFLSKKYSPLPLLSVVLFCGPFLFGQIMGQMRQPLANCLLYMCIIPFLLRNKKWSVFFISLFIGFCLHKSIILIAIFLPFMGKVYSKKQLKQFGLISIGCFILSSVVHNYILNIIPNSFLLAKTAINYLNSNVSFNLGMLERIVLFVVVLFYSCKYRLYAENKVFRIFLNLYGLGMLLYISLIHVSSEFAVRGTNGLYFSIIFILPYLIKKAIGRDKSILIVGSILWCSYLLVSFVLRLPNEYYPYQSII